jgi:hypothetical protein
MNAVLYCAACVIARFCTLNANPWNKGEGREHTGKEVTDLVQFSGGRDERSDAARPDNDQRCYQKLTR